MGAGSAGLSLDIAASLGQGNRQHHLLTCPLNGPHVISLRKAEKPKSMKPTITAKLPKKTSAKDQRSRRHWGFEYCNFMAKIISAKLVVITLAMMIGQAMIKMP